jgi:hypothetical protein
MHITVVNVVNAPVWLVVCHQTTKIGGIQKKYFAILCVFKFHQQSSRACRWVQSILRKISLELSALPHHQDTG